MSVRKDFSSLKKHRHSGVLPRNLLAGQTNKIEIPTATTVNTGALFVVKLTDLSDKSRSQDIRTCFFLPIAIIDSGLNEVPAWSIDVASIEYNGSKVVSTGEQELLLNLSKNGKYLFFTRSRAFIDKMVIPKDALRHVWATSDDRNVLFVLQKKFGLIYVNFATKSPNIRHLFKRDASAWIGGRFLVEDAKLVAEIYSLRLQKREKSIKDPAMVIKPASLPDTSQVMSDGEAGEESSQLGASDDVLLNGLPVDLSSKKAKPRKTRAISKMMEKDPELFAKYSEKSVDYEEDDDDDEVVDDDAPIIQETPAPFDPPLRYTLTNGKKFIVAYNDFKTLYNNDWINDTLIDFFIAYDIDRAEHKLHLIQENEVYAFNSFFFTKLMSKAEDQETPDYYGNIRRWLAKLDLMSYERVILPINEHLHWFCAIIKNLPSLVQSAKEYNKDPKKGQINEITGKKYKVEPVVEVFVLDSLRQSHPNISGPLRTLIDEYCKDKYDVPIPPELIRFQSARVPKQQNFNDCGIHVIYNVRKWLSEPTVCEKVWRRFGKSQRGYFSVSERNNMRHASIDCLLELHKEQGPEHSPSAEEVKEDHSDDEIELISYHSSKPQEAESEGEKKATTEADKAELEKPDTLEVLPKSQENPSDQSSTSRSQSKQSTPKANSVEALSQKKSRSSTPVRTLDPRVFKSSSSPKNSPSAKSDARGPIDYLAGKSESLATKGDERLISNPAYQVEHPQVRRMCMKLHLKPHTIDFLNQYFVNHSKKYDSLQRKLIEFVKKYNFFDPKVEKDQCELLIANFKEQFQEPRAPLDEPFVIQEADDSNGELNQSVSDLRILTDAQKIAPGTATPEATRNFMREADQSSPVRLRKSAANSSIDAMFSSASPSHHTRSWDQQIDEDSDLEVLGDETLRIVSSGSKKNAKSSRALSKLAEVEKRRRNRKVLGDHGPDQTSRILSADSIVSIPDEENSAKTTNITRDKSAISGASSLHAKGLPTGSKRRRVDPKIKSRHAYK